jgi:hypothetical protein
MSNPIATPEELMEDQEETIAKLRDRLGREPMTEEIKAERDRLIRGAYASMAVAAVTLGRWRRRPKNDVCALFDTDSP